LYEPCGLTQMYSLRYGTLPIAHCTGGLADSIVDYQEGKLESTGFLYSPNETWALLGACRRALQLFQQRGELSKVRRQAMKAEFSWDRSAEAYEAVYARAMQG
jgi:starch synthase